jgi:hypothetical protein
MHGKPSSSTKIDERLGRVETLLERLVEKEASQDSDDRGISSSPDHGQELLPQLSSNTAHAHETGPLVSLYDASADSTDSAFIAGGNNNAGKVPVSTGSSTRLGRTRQTLSALLPSQADGDIISAATNTCLISFGLRTASFNRYIDDDPINSSNLDAIAEQDPTIIARTLLYIAVCLQQLPPEFDTSKLQMCERASILNVAEDYTTTVASLVTTDDTLSSTMPGLECLILQSLFHMNAGQLQRSWITIRRALTVAQLLNLPSEYVKPLDEASFDARTTNRLMWEKVVQVDRYLSMLMGLPCGTGDDCFGDQGEDVNDFQDVNGPHADRQRMFERRLSIITGAFSKRNQNQDTKDFKTTGRISEMMTELHRSMPHAWWDTPQLTVGGEDLMNTGQYDRLFVQTWFFQLRALLHLPFLLREDPSNMFELSRLICVNSARELIFRYLALRTVNSTQIMCKVIDFVAFIACVIVIISRLRPRSFEKEDPEYLNEKAKDSELIHDIIRAMEVVARSDREVVVRESVMVLKTLLDINSPSKKLRLTIPYIGTISVLGESHAEQPVVQPKCSISSIISVDNEHPQQSLANPPSPSQGWLNTQPFSPLPYLSFDPSFEEDQMIQGWEPEPPEEIFFYSMMGSDVGGEWIF